MVAGYGRYGYAMVELPRLPLAERAEFVIDLING
jgi:predicted ATPase